MAAGLLVCSLLLQEGKEESVEMEASERRDIRMRMRRCCVAGKEGGAHGLRIRPPVPVPSLGLSESDKQCIGDRSCIMARHILADQPQEYIQAQVSL